VRKPCGRLSHSNGFLNTQPEPNIFKKIELLSD